ncbi:hypothetical protein EKO27_g5349 [Xylaria grammica]|uniref:SHSP domain-containing protein n=1 Tax=Xylaria grammica TaxID=363999 RepID=A0A439D5S1_9PEZI|nr:hypothetical protein EKO27_g5349 [Xylaria grammica]
MSAFTHHPFYATQNNDFGTFGSLFRFIDDWDKTFGGQQQGRNSPDKHRQARRPVQTFTPRFDMRETEQNYELHGELPGVEKKDVDIEFSDPQTIVIRGNVERTYTAGTPPADTHSNKSFQATVEDEKEEGDAAASAAVVESPKPDDTPAVPQAPKPKHKYWVYERSVGNFARSFSFPSRVEPENVKASLDNGILTVVVPKAKKHESRRIAIH